MKRLATTLVVIMFFLCAGNLVQAESKKFSIYTDKIARGNHYYPSGWMGDWGDIKIDTGWKENPHSGDTCMKIIYTAEQKQGAGWAGIYWQNPPNNWGTLPGGYDLTGLSKLVCWIKGGKGGEILTIKFGGITGEYADSDSESLGPITLTTEWKQCVIDLKGKDLSYISGGFCWVANAAENPEGFTVYFDDIYYE